MSTVRVSQNNAFSRYACITSHDQSRGARIKMKLVIAALLAGSVAAFAPARVGMATSSLNDFDSELGVQEPLGFFDPIGMLEDVDQERFNRLCYVEVKHGRICQLAFLG